MKRVDVAIVGGGPAGTAAAREAALAGADALLVEKGVPRNDREELGPDSTDAAGMLDYWVDILDIPFEEIPDDVVLRTLDRTEFYGPNESCVMENTGIESSYDEGFGFTFHRARMDDWFRERAETAGAEYRVGVSVTDVESDLTGGHTHRLVLSDGEEVEAEYLVLADGPQRQVTMRVLDRLTPDDRPISAVLSPDRANHIAYQEYREFPEELFDPEALKFWWGVMPGETAYPWIFPNDGTVARVGLTMPIGMDIDAVADREKYDLLRPEDDRIPRGGEYIERLLEREYGDEYDLADFPLVEDRGKSGGTETYPISSTRPIDSPTKAGIAVVGGAMGTTSAFHEGGYHVAARTGKIAGELAATGRLEAYNDRWKDAIGEEILRNVTFADLVSDYRPDDWDRTFSMASDILADEGEGRLLKYRLSSGIRGAKLVTKYKMTKRKYRNGKYVQFREDDYEV
ncbi:NAD(P)/FAD-dependent oxidoreductase [Halorussus salilacus]|uniref:NAD(P)/FAD-dependent oxidoreductase n=1 Tax=Halorussus salilacus TaxID=2953750 RepID=UPI0020A2090A|nr:NAD(P)/FAD-dependent oxidoreductase [Halorussus salilacus]USZ67780.1 NAD(P)/FAD-dependent oxidoreductase [Halorussus salilacus]